MMNPLAVAIQPILEDGGTLYRLDDLDLEVTHHSDADAKFPRLFFLVQHAISHILVVHVFAVEATDFPWADLQLVYPLLHSSLQVVGDGADLPDFPMLVKFF